jgi:hypothetical protein
MNIKDDTTNFNDLDVKITMENSKTADPETKPSFENNKNKAISSSDQKAKDDNVPKEKVDFTNFLAHAHNPIVVFFTLIFKVSAAVM